MPVLFLDRLPLPNLKIYTALSVLLLSSSVYYAVQVTSQPGFKRNVTEKVQSNSVVINAAVGSSSSADGTDPPNRNDDIIFSNDDDEGVDDSNGTVSLTNVMYYMVEEPLCIWTLINMAYCCLILIGKIIQKIVFGELRVSEQQHVKDKFWNFVFYKFIFIFGVMNVQFMDEVVLWCSWFSVLGFLHLLAQLCKDRFEYLSFSPTMPKWTHVRLLSLLIGILVTSSVLLVICVLVGLHAGINTFAFMGAECVLLNVCTLFVIVRYALHLWDMNHDGVWENRGTYIYYTELVFELMAFFVDLLHHIHMLLWSNIFLSMASLVICMQIRYLFYEIQRRFKKHKNYLRVVRHMEQNYPMGTTDELAANSDDCAICWDKMESARKLPCGHLFHNSCLQSWLEQDTSCPTCRTSLAGPSENNSDPLRQRNTERGNPMPNRLAGNPIGATALPNRTTTNHFFHFDGSRYVSWFPSFSVEVTHTQLLHRQAHMQTSQLDSMVWQVQQLFPQMPLNAIRDDLRTTRSVDATVDNILEERLVAPPRKLQVEKKLKKEMILRKAELELSLLKFKSAIDQGVLFQMQGGARMGSNVEPTTSLQDSSPPSQSTSDTLSDFNESRGNSPIMDEDLDLLDESQFQQAAMDLESSELHHVNVGGRFSKSPQEREKMLAGRKDDLIKQAKKRYVMRKFGEGGARHEETGDAENRRYLAYEAARRRLKRNGDET